MKKERKETKVKKSIIGNVIMTEKDDQNHQPRPNIGYLIQECLEMDTKVIGQWDLRNQDIQMGPLDIDQHQGIEDIRNTNDWISHMKKETIWAMMLQATQV